MEKTGSESDAPKTSAECNSRRTAKRKKEDDEAAGQLPTSEIDEPSNQSSKDGKNERGDNPERENRMAGQDRSDFSKQSRQGENNHQVADPSLGEETTQGRQINLPTDSSEKTQQSDRLMAEFISLTGLDSGIAQALLETCGWDLTIALDAHAAQHQQNLDDSLIVEFMNSTELDWKESKALLEVAGWSISKASGLYANYAKVIGVTRRPKHVERPSSLHDPSIRGVPISSDSLIFNIKTSNVRVVNWILDADPSLAKTMGPRSALHVAVMNGLHDLALRMVQLGADVHALDEDGWTVLRHCGDAVFSAQLEAAAAAADHK